MARIKQVLNERRLAYDQAVKLHEDGVTPEQLEAVEAEKNRDAVGEPKGTGMLEEEATLGAVQGDAATSAENKPSA